MKHWKAIAAVLLVPLVLAACLFVPGKFQSAMTIRADRSFTFTYKGEVLAVDLGDSAGKAMGGLASALGNSTDDGVSNESAPASLEDTQEEKAEKEAKYRDIAAKLSKEAGYRVAEYRGGGKFFVDYELSGVLSHNFVFPYNQDTGLIFPFVTVELRGKDVVRVKAPGFGKQNDSDGGIPSGEDATASLDGTFTLTTDAEIVSQNQEDGAVATGKSRTITWRVTPTSKDVPMAVLKVRGI